MAAQYERLGYGSPDGSQWGGSSSEAIGFYGATPIVRINIGNNLSTATHASTLISTIVAALVSTGLFATSS